MSRSRFVGPDGAREAVETTDPTRPKFRRPHDVWCSIGGLSWYQEAEVVIEDIDGSS
jgi:hypothetical protein